MRSPGADAPCRGRVECLQTGRKGLDEGADIRPGTAASTRRGHVTATKTVFIKTYGCQMNVYDSDRMSDTLAPMGYVQTDDADTADLVILNTCHIREKAAREGLFGTRPAEADQVGAARETVAGP